MKEFLETVQLALVCLVPISLFALSAWLIYSKSDGWGWFLICVLLVVGSFRAQVGD